MTGGVPDRCLSACFWNYDRTLPLVDGRVSIAGWRIECTILPPEEAFARAFGSAEFDVTELSLSNYMSAVSSGASAYTAIPVFLSRAFRHSTIYVRTDRGIRHPRDLVGRKVGLQEYEMTAAVVVRGLLRDQYDIAPEDITWYAGNVEQGETRSAAPPVIAGISINDIPEGDTLNEMLADGRLDGILALRPPSCLRTALGKVARLFPDWRSAERAYFERTGFFPIMHAVGVRTDPLAADRTLVRSLFEAFARAKEIAIRELENLQAPKVTLPWVAAELGATREIMGHDYWPYGIEANRPVLEAIARYHYQDGLSPRQLAIEELFHPATINS